MKIIFGFLASFALAENYSQITKLTLDLKQRYSFCCATVLFKEDAKESYRALSIGKILMMSAGLGGSVTVSSISNYIKMLETVEVQGSNHGRPFYLVLGDKVKLKKELMKLSYSMNMQETIWLVHLDENTVVEEYFRDMNIVYNMDLLVVQSLRDGNEKITEVYRTSMQQPVRMLNYGLWSFEHGLKSTLPVSFYLRRQNLEGINFKVLVKQSSDASGRYTGHKFGILGAAWMDLQQKLNFTSTFVLVKESELFLPEGIVRLMNKEKMDVGLTEVIMSQEKCSVTHCLRPIITTWNRLYFKKTAINIQWDSILKPFHIQTWTIILFWFMLSGLGLDMFYRIGRKYRIEEDESDVGFVNSFLTVFNAICQKGSTIKPDSLPCRVVLFLSYGVASILFTVYSASLASFVTVQEPFLPFKNLKELLQLESHTLQPIRYSDLHISYVRATDAFDREIYNKLIPPESTLPGNKREALERICRDEGMVYIGTEFETEKAVMDVNLNGKCEIISPEKPLNMVYITILLSKSFHFKELFNIQLDRLIFSGLVSRHTTTPLIEYENADVQTFSSVGIIQIVQIYAILILGIFSSILIFIIEKIGCKVMKKNLVSNFVDRCRVRRFFVKENGKD